jgi:DNA-binding CsgD family transcriptional regulator
MSLWQDGEFDLCLRELDLIADDRQTPDSIFLRSRALIRSGRPDDARERLSSHARHLAGADEQATHAMLLGAAYAQGGDCETALACFAEARSFKAHHTIAAENDYQQALVRYQLGQMDEARALLTRTLRPVEDIVCARAQSLLGWLDVAANNHGSALLHFKTSLETLAHCSARDTHLQARTLCAVAIAEAELRSQNQTWLEAEAAKVRWTVNLVREHVQTLRHIGLAHQRRGNPAAAFERFIAGAHVAPGTAWAVLCYADCSGNALSCGEPRSADGFAALAAAIAADLSWDAVSGEQRLALLALAQALARVGDAASARAYRDLYHERPGVPSTDALHHDARLETYERHVDGDIALALGDTARACELLSSVQSAWDRLNYRWRARDAEAALRRVRGDGATPGCTVARKSRDPLPFDAQLSARDHRILRMVVEGRCDREIGRVLSIAPRTVKNIVNGMYKLFGVHKRVELIARALRADPTLIVADE